jgi:hypothetical protein
MKLVINLSTTVLSIYVPLLFAQEKTLLKSHLIPSKKRINFWSKNVPNFHDNNGPKMPTAQIEHKLHSALK